MRYTDTSDMRKALLTVVPYLLVLLVLAVVEIDLRIFDRALDNPIVTEVRYDGIDWYELNRSYLQKYFPAGTPLVPEFKPVLFRKRKAPGSYRVLCLGESSMFGTPYMMTANIPGILRKQLRHRYPGREIEVINLGASAINSNVILDLSKDLAQLQPDLVVVYMGHNEFYGPEGIGASFVIRHFPSLIPVLYAVRDLRLVRLLAGKISLTARQDTSGGNLMRQVSASGSVRLGSDEAAWVFSRFEQNLRSSILWWKSHDVPIIVSDVSSNLVFPPFRSDTLDPRLFGSALSAMGSGDTSGARARLRELLRIDSANAYANYWLGRLDMASGYSGPAKEELLRARDNDLLKFRAPSQINTIIRDVCRSEQAAFVSADSLFSALSAGGIPGNELFWEHLHPTARGYYEIARLLYSTIVGMQLLPSDSAGPAASVLPFDPDSLSICELDLLCADLSIQHLTGRWPFSNYHRAPAVLESADSTLLSIASNTYENRIVWDRGCYESAAYFMNHGRMRDAETSYETVIEEYPRNYYAHYLLGRLQASRGDWRSAMRHLQISVQSNPGYPYARLDLGMNEINAGRNDEAIAQLDTALALAGRDSLEPLGPIIHYGLAAAYANRSRFDEALREIDTSLRLQPGYRDAMNLREEIRRKAGRR